MGQPCDTIQVLSDILMSSPEIVFAVDGNGNFLFANETAMAVLALPVSDCVGYHWSDLGLSRDVWDPFMENTAQVLAEEEARMFTTRGSNERADRTFQLSVNPVRCEEDTVFAVLVIARDITEFVAAE